MSATLSGGKVGDTVTLPVIIGSTNYADSTANVVITLTDKSDAGVTVSGAPAKGVTYGDADFTLKGKVKDAGLGTGVWTWTSSDDAVLRITPNGATATVKVLKAGPAWVTARYESDTTVGTEKTAVKVQKADPKIKIVPAGLTATYGQTLADVPLYNPKGNDPGTWTWMDDTTAVDDVGELVFKAKFTPDDSTNYRVLRNVGVLVTVGKASNPATVITPVYLKNNGFSIDLEECVIRNGATGQATFAFLDKKDTKGCTLENSFLASGNTMGTVPIKVSIAEDDHYHALTTKILVNITDKGIQTITADDVTTTYGATDAKVTATTDGGGEISYATGSGNDVVDVNAKTGALTIKKAGTATVVVTAKETATYMQASRRVTVTVKKAKSVAATVKANNRGYDGTKKPLVTVTGEPIGGEMKYALGTDATTAPTSGYTASLPKAIDPGTYYVWYMVKGDANHNNSDAVCVTVKILAPISAKVTFKVVGGAWDDGSTRNKTVTLTGYEGDTLRLAKKDIPAVGNKPDKNYKAGAWDVTPSTKKAITEDTTFTYTYQPKKVISAKVTFKVVGGAWDDGTTRDKIVTLIGYEGDTLKLAKKDIPAVGKRPDKNYKAGSWDVTPSTKKAITKDTTYTYTYEKASRKAAVVTKVPKALKPVYNGQPRKLVSAGRAKGGKMAYAVTKAKEAPKASAYAAKIPTARNAGAYYVWYKAVGDADHLDSEAASVKVVVYRRNIGKCAITVKDLAYTGKALKPKVTVSYGDTVLKEDRDYTLTYSDELIRPGTWHVRVTGKGNFNSSKKLAFKVYMPPLKISEVSSGTTWVTVKWNQKAAIRYCQLQVSRRKDFSVNKTVKYEIDRNMENHVKAVVGLRENTKYYVRIRCYEIIGGKKYYSAWSEVKAVRTKSATCNNAPAKPVEMAVGEVLDLNALLSQAEIEGIQSWSSDDAEIATVTPKGVVTAAQPGETAVMAILEDGEAIEFAITVREDGITLLDLGEGDLALNLDEYIPGDVIGNMETNIEIMEVAG